MPHALRFILILSVMLTFTLNADARKKKKSTEPDVVLLTPDKPSSKYKAMPDSHHKSPAKPRIVNNFPIAEQMHGIDVSHYQNRINWSETSKDKKVGFVYVKATEGRDHIDETYAYNVSEARKYGVKVGAYHFFRPNVPAADQFRNFTNVVNRRDQDLIPLIDVEVTGNVSETTMQQRLLELLQMVTRSFGVKPMIYTGRNFYNKHFAGVSKFREYKFMIAQYTPDEPVLLNDDDYILWQYTGHGSVKGIRGSVDQSCFHGRHHIGEIMMR